MVSIKFICSIGIRFMYIFWVNMYFINLGNLDLSNDETHLQVVSRRISSKLNYTLGTPQIHKHI